MLPSFFPVSCQRIVCLRQPCHAWPKITTFCWPHLLAIYGHTTVPFALKIYLRYSKTYVYGNAESPHYTSTSLTFQLSNCAYHLYSTKITAQTPFPKHPARDVSQGHPCILYCPFILKLFLHHRSEEIQLYAHNVR